MLEVLLGRFCLEWLWEFRLFFPLWLYGRVFERLELLREFRFPFDSIIIINLYQVECYQFATIQLYPFHHIIHNLSIDKIILKSNPSPAVNPAMIGPCASSAICRILQSTPPLCTVEDMLAIYCITLPARELHCPSKHLLPCIPLYHISLTARQRS